MLEICLRLNVRCVSTYVFAIENFKRSPEEVNALMALAEEKLLELCQHGWVWFISLFCLKIKPPRIWSELLDKYGVRLNILGNRELLPLAVQKAACKAEDMTRHNNQYASRVCVLESHSQTSRAILNLCMSYAARDEITSAVQSTICAALEAGPEAE